jgi:hypothetical protein
MRGLGHVPAKSSMLEIDLLHPRLIVGGSYAGRRDHVSNGRVAFASTVNHAILESHRIDQIVIGVVELSYSCPERKAIHLSV